MYCILVKKLCDDQNMKILIIDDNRLLAESIKRQLAVSYIVDIASTGEQGIDQARTLGYGVILLDLKLPDMNGYDVCHELRNGQVATPILILSGTQDVMSRVRLFEAGADDYVTKPFNVDELRARITALVRRGKHTVIQETIKIHDLVIDIRRRRVQRAGVSITLRRKEFDILEYLVRNRGSTVTRAMIFDHVWESGKEAWKNTVDVHIKHLRDKIDRPFSTQLIKTTYGIGYTVDDAE
jgi:DNA-binding response OmpR family regulator